MFQSSFYSQQIIHFAKYCNKCDDIKHTDETEDSNEETEYEDIEDSNEETEYENTEDSDEDNYVFCCQYCNKEFFTLKSVKCHENLHCNKKNKQKNNKKYTCYKCGRNGHCSNECYASKHVNGQYIK